MSYLSAHWSFLPFGVLIVALAGWHEAGLWRLARACEGGRGRRRRSLLFYAGLVVLAIALVSPLEYWSYRYFFVHMLQHLLLMFAAPSLVVAGAPWSPLAAAAPRALAGARGVRAVGRVPLRPWVSIALFNAAMIGWHLPGPLDLAERNVVVHDAAMIGSFVAVGVLFWLQFIPSEPFRRQMPLLSRAAALLATNVIMIAVAMALSVLASGSVYPVYAHVPGVTLPPLSDQQLGAAILWVCGDFWALPTMVSTVRQIIAADGSMGAALDAIVSRASSRNTWGRPQAGVLDSLRAQPPSSPDAGPRIRRR